MKHATYIIALVAALILSACNEIAVTPDPLNEPIKDVGLKIYDVSQMLPMPNGSALTVTVNNDGYQACMAILQPDGSCILSEPFLLGYYIERIYVNASSEILVSSFCYDDELGYCYRLSKFDSQCNLLYQTLSETEPVALFDNGNIACFKREVIESTGEESLVMKIIDNNLTYIMEQDFVTDYAYSFDDKILLLDIVSGNFCIYKTDGSFHCSGTVDDIIIDVTYLDGYLYFTTRDDYLELDDDADNFNGPWIVHKVDTNGNVIFSTKIDAYQMFGNFSVVDGTLITTGSVSSDHQRNEGYGSIYLINNENGKLIDTISVDYNGCEVLPLHVVSDGKNGYNVYVVRQDYYDSDRSGFEGMFSGRLFVYHTDDLHKLDINTINQ